MLAEILKVCSVREVCPNNFVKQLSQQIRSQSNDIKKWSVNVWNKWVFWADNWFPEELYFIVPEMIAEKWPNWRQLPMKSIRLYSTARTASLWIWRYDSIVW